MPETQTQVTFGGKPTVRISPDSDVVSDPIPLSVVDGDNLSVSIFVPGTTPNASYHSRRPPALVHDARQRRRPRGADRRDRLHEHHQQLVVPGRGERRDERAIGAVVALGDSITEGANSTSNTNHRWPDYLAARLNAVGNPVGVRGVVNEGISGNSVLKDYNCCGGNPSGLSRLDRDVISHDGVRTVIVALGINDIGNYPNET